MVTYPQKKPTQIKMEAFVTAQRGVTATDLFWRKWNSIGNKYKKPTYQFTGFAPP